jgi:hypothetical protein
MVAGLRKASVRRACAVAGLCVAYVCSCGGDSTSSAGGTGGAAGSAGSDGLVTTGGSGAEASGGAAGADSTGDGGGADSTGGTGGAQVTGGTGGATTRGGTGGATTRGGTGGADTSGGTGGLVATGGSDSGGSGGGADCEYNGEVYADGTSFPADDGCNTCSCSDGMVLCTQMACVVEDGGTDGSSGDAGVDGSADDAGVDGSAEDAGTDGLLIDTGQVDPRLLDVWYFDIPTGAIRWYQIALCDGGRALVWTSFNGSGEPDQETPIEGSWEGSGLTVSVTYTDPSGDAGPVSIQLEYDPELDMLGVSAEDDVLWEMSSGVRLAPLSSVTYRLSCD